MKKKMMFLLSVCLIMTMGMSGFDAMASTDLSGRLVTNESSGRISGEAELEESPDQENGEAGAEETPAQKEEEPEPEEKPYTTQSSLSILLYKGDTGFVGISYCTGDKYTAVSSNPSVVKISKKGKIEALKCGKADVTVILENDGKRDKLVLHVRVKSSSYKSTNPRGKGVTKVESASQAGLTAYCELSPKKSLQLNAKAASGDTKITYDSTDASVAKVDSKGIITAKKKGTCTIRAVLQDGEKKAVYCVRLYVKDPQKLTVSNKQKDNYFKDSVMVGNSLGVGLASYCRRQYAGFLGNAKHFSSGSYSLMNDKRPISATSLHPKYKGKKYRVKDALKVMGVKKAFLSFGMNDLNIYGVKGSANVYQKFIKELQKTNKGLEVYIVSQTPVRRTSGKLENGCIREFNRLMETYAKNTKDVYFVNIFDYFLDGSGRLASKYCSDGFCHLTSAGYEVWTSQLKKFAGEQIKKEIKAGDAVATVKESHLEQDYRIAKKEVEKLELGALRTSYLKQLKKLKGKLKT